jgi:hypothetical protein
MKLSLRTTALSTLAVVALAAGCGHAAPAPSDDSTQADTIQKLHPTAFQKRLKFAQLPPRITLASELAVGVDDLSAARAGYPAFLPNTPVVVDQGGPTLKKPRIVTVTWDGEVNRDVYEKFGDEIGATSYWRDNTSEYGVGPAFSGPQNHVHIATPITTISDQGIDDLVRASVTNAASGWPAPDQQTIYNIYLPPNALTFGGQDACQFGVGGYHTDSPIDLSDGGSTAEFLYAVNINCPAKWDVHTITLIASHELVESVTDPFPNVTPAYVGFDPDHLAFDIMNQFQDEVGDACEFFRSSEYVGSGSFPFGLQRNWSNKSAKAGHAPCVPRTKLPYFNVTTFAASMDKINVDFTSIGDTVHPTAGYLATAGKARTFEIGFYSDAPTGGDWTVWTKVPASLPLTDQNGNPIPNGQVAAAGTIDNPSGHNGHRANVTITPSSFNALGVLYLELHSVLQGGEEKVYPVLLSPNAAN